MAIGPSGSAELRRIACSQFLGKCLMRDQVWSLVGDTTYNGGVVLGDLLLGYELPRTLFVSQFDSQNGWRTSALV